MRDLVDRTDPIKQMKRHLEALTSVDLHKPSESELEKIDDAVEALLDLCSEVDIASGSYFEGKCNSLTLFRLSQSRWFPYPSADAVQ